jgi:hypothetical protein
VQLIFRTGIAPVRSKGLTIQLTTGGTDLYWALWGQLPKEPSLKKD